MPLTIPSETNVDIIHAKVHARRAAMYEKDRLGRLCDLRSFANLVAEFFPEEGIEDHRQLQKRLTEDHLSQLTWIPDHLGGRPHELFMWLLRRYQIENLKVIFRGFHARRGAQEVSRHLISTPDALALPAQRMLSASAADELAEMVPGKAGKKIEAAALAGAAAYKKKAEPFFFEAALDGFFYSRLLQLAGEQSIDDLTCCLPLLALDANCYLIILVIRARFNYDFPFDEIEPLVRVPGAVPLATLRAVHSADSVRDAVGALPKTFGKVMGSDVDDPEALERAFKAYSYTRANAAFYGSGISMAVPVAFYYLKRIELQNLIRLTEAYRYGLSAEQMRRSLVPPLE